MIEVLCPMLSYRGRLPHTVAPFPLCGGVLSFKAQQWALEQEDVKGLDKWVLFILAYRDSHDEPHGCFPSFNRMAKDCGLSRATIMRCVARLISSKKISRIVRRKKAGHPDSNYYHFPQVWGEQVVANSNQGGVRKRRGVVANSAPNQKLTGSEQETTRAQKPSAAPSLSIEEQKEAQRKFLAMMKRVSGEHDIQVAIHAGTGPEVQR